MPHNFVNLNPDLEQACAESLVLTTTERLRRNLVLAYNAKQQQSGSEAWTTPRVLTLEGYLITLYAQLRLDAPELPGLLGSEAEFQLFHATAPRGGWRLVPLAQQAWQLCRQWQIPFEREHFSGTENGRTFLDWAQRVERRLKTDDAITRADLPHQPLLQSSERRLSCLAFERLPSAFSGWLGRQSAAGTVIDELNPAAEGVAEAHRVTFDSPTEELAVAAQWVHGLLTGTSDEMRIGIVVPDLAARQTSVVRQFTAELDPLLESGTDGLIDVGGGVPLADQPVWLVALNWLTLCYQQLPVEAACRCLENPYLSLPGIDHLPETAPPSVDLIRLAGLVDAPDLARQVQLLPEPVSRSLGSWLTDFLQILERAGWQGRSAGSVQYQAQQEIVARIEALARSGDRRLFSPAEALSVLNDFLSTLVFAPERSPAPVQIMGYLETTGLSFSHLWIMGLDDQTWPPPLNLNPFVPGVARRVYGVPRSTPEQEAVFASERLAHWQSATRHLIVSHPRHSGESELRPSPLIRRIPEMSWLDFQPGRVHPFFDHNQGQLESLADSIGPPLPPGEHRGGTGRIRDQAVCPFKGFAVHRLGLKEVRAPHGLPDALDRGTLIHEALHRLYEAARTEGIPPEGLDVLAFGRAADQALARHYGRFPEAFRQRERQRLMALLDAWNALETRRGELAIEALELGINADFDGIGLRLRVDRLDRLGDALIVIDYKTGRIGSRLNRDRLVDPQLPLYALCNPEVQGVLYAEINETRPRLKGISELDLEMTTLEPPAGGNWETQRNIWQRQVDTLTREIRDGFAAVDPYESRACQTCHLQALCRIDMDPETAEADGLPEEGDVKA